MQARYLLSRTSGVKTFMKKQGFTFIEILIVIVIMGVLAALLTPQLLGARARAHAISAQSWSAGIYKTATAALTADQSLSAPDVVASFTSASDCTAAQPAVNGFGWQEASSSVTSCTLASNGQNDFTVTTAGGGKTFVNGAMTP